MIKNEFYRNFKVFSHGWYFVDTLWILVYTCMNINCTAHVSCVVAQILSYSTCIPFRHQVNIKCINLLTWTQILKTISTTENEKWPRTSAYIRGRQSFWLRGPDQVPTDGRGPDDRNNEKSTFIQYIDYSTFTKNLIL